MGDPRVCCIRDGCVYGGLVVCMGDGGVALAALILLGMQAGKP